MAQLLFGEPLTTKTKKPAVTKEPEVAAEETEEDIPDEEKAKISGIIELYPCIQSEGSRAGFPTIAMISVRLC